MGQRTKNTENIIAVNKKATHDYFILEKLEAGLVLEGWEVKGIRALQAQIKEAYVNQGPVMKRFRAASMGRASKLRRPTSHLTIVIATDS